MYQRTVLLTFLFLALTTPWIKSLEATICDCSDVKEVGLLDTSLPSYCDHHRTIESPKPAQYELWTRLPTPATGKAYTCQRWTEEKHVTGYFPHTFDTTFRTVTEMVTADACWIMIHSKRCGDHEMTETTRGWSHTATSEGEGVWLSEKTYATKNCDLVEIPIALPCATCQLETPIGILHQTRGQNYMLVGHTTIVWENVSPSSRTKDCGITEIIKGSGRIWQPKAQHLGRLIDDNKEIEVLYNQTNGNNCGRDNLFPVAGLPDTFIRVFPIIQPPIDANVTITRHRRELAEIRARKVAFKAGHAMSGVLYHARRCLISDSARRRVTIVSCRAKELDNLAHFTLFPDGRLKESPESTECITRDNNFLIWRPCTGHIHQNWTYRPATGELENKQFGVCIEYDENLEDVPVRKCTANDTQRWEFLQSPLNEYLETVTVHTTQPAPSTFQVSKNNTSNSTSPNDNKKELPPGLQILSRLSGDPATLDINKAENAVSGKFQGVLHLQTLEGRAIDRENLLADELRRTQCLALRTRVALATTQAPLDGLLAAQYLGLRTCQRLDAAGNNVMIQQCAPVNVTVSAKLSKKCGYLPYVNGSTLGRNGLTLVPFTECFWTKNRANIGGKIYVYREGVWEEIPYQFQLPALDNVQEFKENVDHSAQFFPVTHTAYGTQTVEQINLLAGIMARVQESSADSASTFILTPDQAEFFPSLTKWWDYIKYGFLGLLLLLVVAITIYILTCIIRILAPALRRMFKGWKKVNTSSKHRHNKPTFDPDFGLI
jgi:Ricin-type beta-trefoil lectin domain